MLSPVDLRKTVWATASLLMLSTFSASAQNANCSIGNLVSADNRDVEGLADNNFECLLAKLEELEKANNSLREDLAQIELTPGPQGPAGPKGDAGQAAEGSQIPVGAVVAFMSRETDPCPGSDWTIFNDAKGRFLVGAGQHNDGELTQRNLGEIGGAEKHKLTVGEMPSHSHQFRGNPISTGGWGGEVTYPVGVGDHQVWKEYVPSGTIDPAGGDQAHNNMPPYLALYFCIKR